jgi:hypothetical protein
MERGGRGGRGSGSRGRGRGAHRGRVAGPGAVATHKPAELPAAVAHSGPVSGNKRPGAQVTPVPSVAVASTPGSQKTRGNKRRRIETPAALESAASPSASTPSVTAVLPASQSNSVALLSAPAPGEGFAVSPRRRMSAVDDIPPAIAPEAAHQDVTEAAASDQPVLGADTVEEALVTGGPNASQDERDHGFPQRRLDTGVEAHKSCMEEKSTAPELSMVAEPVDARFSGHTESIPAIESVVAGSAQATAQQVDAPKTQTQCSEHRADPVAEPVTPAARKSPPHTSPADLHAAIQLALGKGDTVPRPAQAAVQQGGVSRKPSWGPSFGTLLPSGMAIAPPPANRPLLPVASPLNAWFLTGGMPAFGQSTLAATAAQQSSPAPHNVGGPMAVVVRDMLDTEKRLHQDFTGWLLNMLK